MDRHQNDLHRLPIIHQDQNLSRMQESVERRLAMPVEPEPLEKKSIDSKKERNNARKPFAARKKKTKNEPPASGSSGDQGCIVDVQA